LNDGSNEGMMHKTRPIFSTQFHPEAKGGPEDSSYLFEKYLQNVQLAKESQKVYKDNRPTQFILDLLSKERVGVEPSPLETRA
jgi:carbamoyl-phosphate synthase small subunit